MATYRAALSEGRAALAGSGIETAALDARLLLARAAGVDMAALVARDSEPLSALASDTFRDHIKRRRSGEPVARILGEAEFWSLRFLLNSATLVPRPETETVVEAVLDQAREDFPPTVRICDLGTGSGAIVIALLKELPQAQAVATDISREALAAAASNAERHGVRSRVTFRLTDFSEGPEGPFDIVVSNPPYIRSEEIFSLQKEVRKHDPILSLDGGPDGLDAFRAILGRVDLLLSKGGLIAFEIGHDQGEGVANLCREAGLREVSIGKDLGGRDRVILACATSE
jgi:release factor glutamine methyltransferase